MLKSLSSTFTVNFTGPTVRVDYTVFNRTNCTITINMSLCTAPPTFFGPYKPCSGSSNKKNTFIINGVQDCAHVKFKYNINRNIAKMLKMKND